MRYFIQLSRPWAWTTAALTLTSAWMEVSKQGLQAELTQILPSVVGIILIVAGGFALNDYLDRELDRGAHPERVLPAGLLTPSEVLHISAVWIALGLATLGVVDLSSMFFGLFAVVFFVLYTPIKNRSGLLGNLVTALLFSTLVVYGGTHGGLETATTKTVTLAAAVALALLGRELIKDLEDQAEDTGYRVTVAMQIGQDATWTLSRVCFALAVLLLLAHLMAVTTASAHYLWIGIPAALLAFCASQGLARLGPRPAVRITRSGFILAALLILFCSVLS